MAEQKTTISATSQAEADKPKGWKMTTLGEVLFKRNQGVNTTTEKVVYGTDGIPVIRAQNISLGQIDFSNIVYINDNTFNRLSDNVKPILDDILYTNIGSQMGVAVKVKTNSKFIIAWNVLRIQVNKDIIDSNYLVYFLNNPKTKQTIVNRNSSSTMPFVSGESIDNLEILLPPLPEQRAIAAVLSSLDDKIELLREQNKALEAIAQTLFKEWFVNFNFPDKNGKPYKASGGKMIDSELGEIPEGWRVGKIKDLVDILSGFAFSSSDFSQDGEYKLVTIKNVQNRFFDPETKDRLSVLPDKMPSYCKLNTGDILLSLTGNVGRICLVNGDNFLLNQRVAKLKEKNPNDYAFTYLLFLQDSIFSLLQSTASGTAQQNLSPIQTGEIEIIIADRKTLNQLGAVANNLIQKINFNNSQIQTLSQLRDTLLPKLMKGEVRVKGFDK